MLTDQARESRLTPMRIIGCGKPHPIASPAVVEILNLQPRNSLAKPYQVKQVRSVLIRYKLAQET
jgi:hypothetical protein